MGRVCCSVASATYQSNMARSDRWSDPLQELQQHQAPAWQQAVAPQPEHHVPAAAWFPVAPHVPHQQHQQHPVIPIVPKFHHVVRLAAPAQHIVAPAQHVAPVRPPAVIRPQVPLPPPGLTSTSKRPDSTSRRCTSTNASSTQGDVLCKCTCKSSKGSSEVSREGSCKDSSSNSK